MNTMVFAFPGNELLANKIREALKAEAGISSLHHFPDGESLIRIQSEVAGKQVLVVASLDYPDHKILPLYYLCKKIKDDGAAHLTLIAPYLAYMRQDKSFHPGEAVSSIYFASLLSSFADQLITVDPHLHRYPSLSELFSIPCSALHSANVISKWICENVSKPVLIGPDVESKQWIADVAIQIDAPFVILNKERLSDRSVKVSITDLKKYESFTPVLLDDIISTGHTMMETLKHLKEAKLNPAYCICVHALFADDAYSALMQSGVHAVVTCNTIAHSSNHIDVSDLIIQLVRSSLE
jgi:ribose-phosphate pyrophosphokinase